MRVRGGVAGCMCVRVLRLRRMLRDSPPPPPPPRVLRVASLQDVVGGRGAPVARYVLEAVLSLGCGLGPAPKALCLQGQVPCAAPRALLPPCWPAPSPSPSPAPSPASAPSPP
jgi:hypothetical protein